MQFVCTILRLAALVQYQRVTDRQTNGRTRDDSIYRASIASRGKSDLKLECRSSLLSGRNIRWPCRMLPLVSHDENADGTDRQTDRRTPDVTLRFLLDAASKIMLNCLCRIFTDEPTLCCVDIHVG